MNPRHFSTKTKRDAFARSHGRCEKCTAHLSTGNMVYDHRIPWEISRDSSLDNCQCLCKTCDAEKTYSTDLSTIAKVHRIHNKAIGIKKPGKKLPGGKNTDISITLRNGVVKRRTQMEKHRQTMARRQIGGIK
jgi:hypothetical protein